MRERKTTTVEENPYLRQKARQKLLVPGARFEHATFGHRALAPFCSPDYESGALARLGYPGTQFAAVSDG